MGSFPYRFVLCASLVLVGVCPSSSSKHLLRSRHSIVIAFSIYVLAGREIFKKRKQLRAFSNPAHPIAVEVENPDPTYKTTESYITSELATTFSPSQNLSDACLSPEDNKGRISTTTRPIPSRSPSVASKGYEPYSVEIHSAPLSPRFGVPPTPTRGASMTHTRNNRAAMEANTAAWGYTKVALLFFISLLVTWVSHPFHTCRLPYIFIKLTFTFRRFPPP